MTVDERIKLPCLALALIASGMAVFLPSVAAADLCGIEAVERPEDFPQQPINILIPRSKGSGALSLSSEMADAIASLTDAQGEPLGIEVNLLFKSDGDLPSALDYFDSLPPNGYNVIQLNDTYASRLATLGDTAPALLALNIAQVTFSQVYVRTNDTRYKTLEEFTAYSKSSETPPQMIANFKTPDGSQGLEDLLITHFIDTNGLRTKMSPNTSQNALEVVGYESGSERYFSMFRPQDDSTHSDALIEQPGDIARLLEGGLLRSIYTLLPEDFVTESLRTRLGTTPAFPADRETACQAYLRFRGFFVHSDLPEDRRRYLEWLFTSAFNSEQFQTYNRALYMDVLYDNPTVFAGYCSSDAANTLFNDSIQSYRSCFSTLPPEAASPEEVIQ